MNRVSVRLQHLYDWTPAFRTVFKKPAPQESNLFQVPQTSGKSGWIVFTYDNNIPVCVWITSQECYTLPCSVDERICNDTILRVEKVGQMEYVVADIWVYNSNCIFACSTFKQRYEWLKEWLAMFTFQVPGTIKLTHKSDLINPQVRGYEAYTDDIGSKGYFIEDDGTSIVQIKKMPLPDCYEVNGEGYLRVPTLKLSQELRKLGDSFRAKCSKQEDGSWIYLQCV